MNVSSIRNNRLQNQLLSSKQMNNTQSFSGGINTLTISAVEVSQISFKKTGLLSKAVRNFRTMVVAPLALFTGHAHAGSEAIAVARHGHTAAVPQIIERAHKPAPVACNPTPPPIINRPIQVSPPHMPRPKQEHVVIVRPAPHHPRQGFIQRPLFIEPYPVIIEQRPIIRESIVETPLVIIEQPQVVKRVVIQHPPAVEQLPEIIEKQPEKIIELHNESSSVYNNEDKVFDPFDTTIKCKETEVPVYRWVQTTQDQPPVKQLVGYKKVLVPVTD